MSNPKISLIHPRETVERGIRLGLELGPVEAGRRLGVPAQTVSNWLRDYKSRLIRAERQFEAQDPDNVPGEIGPPVHWSERLQQEADAAGRDATYIRGLTVDAMEQGQAALVSAGARFYSVLVNNAQLLSGNATSRPETAEETQQRLVEVMQATLRNKRSRAS